MLVALLWLLLLPAHAETIKSSGYVVRTSVVNSMQIPAQVAQGYGIQRDGALAVVTITLQRPTTDDPLHPLAAKVTGDARTLMGQRDTLEFRRISDGGSIFSVATLPINENRQQVTFDLEVTTIDGSTLIPLEFTHTLYRR